MLQYAPLETFHLKTAVLVFSVAPSLVSALIPGYVTPIIPQYQGVVCTFRHSEQARSNKIVCHYWSQGQCRSGAGCTFVHSGPSSQHSGDGSNGMTHGDRAHLCHFFQQGKCVKGSSCPFVHEPLSQTEEAEDQRGTEGTASKRVGEAALAASAAEESAPLLAMQGALKATREGPSFHTRASRSETSAAAEQCVQNDPMRGGRHDRPNHRGEGGGRHGNMQGGRGTGGRGPDRGGRGGRGGHGVWGNMNHPMGTLPMFGQPIMMSPMGPVQVDMGPNGPSITPISPASLERIIREGPSQLPMPMNEMLAQSMGRMGMNKSSSPPEHGKKHQGQFHSGSYNKIISPSIVEAADGGFVTRKKLKKTEGGETGRGNKQQQQQQQQFQQQQWNTRRGMAMQRNFSQGHRHQDKKQKGRQSQQESTIKSSALLHGSDTATENAKPVTFKVRSLDEMKSNTIGTHTTSETTPEAVPVAAVSEVEVGTPAITSAACPLATTPSISSSALADLGDDLGTSLIMIYSV